MHARLVEHADTPERKALNEAAFNRAREQGPCAHTRRERYWASATGAGSGACSAHHAERGGARRHVHGLPVARRVHARVHSRKVCRARRAQRLSLLRQSPQLLSTLCDSLPAATGSLHVPYMPSGRLQSLCKIHSRLMCCQQVQHAQATAAQYLFYFDEGGLNGILSIRNVACAPGAAWRRA